MRHNGRAVLLVAASVLALGLVVSVCGWSEAAAPERSEGGQASANRLQRAMAGRPRL